MGKTSKESSNPAMAKSIVDDEEMKREKRRAANRRSALKSRYREMVMLEELQRNTRELSVHNAALRQENESLRSLATTIRKVQSEAHQLAQFVSSSFVLARGSFFIDYNRLILTFVFCFCFISEVLNDACRSKHKHASTSVAAPWNFLSAAVECNGYSCHTKNSTPSHASCSTASTVSATFRSQKTCFYVVGSGCMV
jgi:hypothetical protein